MFFFVYAISLVPKRKYILKVKYVIVLMLKYFLPSQVIWRDS